MNRLSYFLAAQCALASRPDQCARVCEEFSAARHGNGHDLCENGGTSNCYHNAEIDEYICSHLYWSDDTREGLFYEPDAATLTDAERSSRLTCIDAGIIVNGLPPTNNLNMALHMFVNSAPVQRRLAEGFGNYSNAYWSIVNQFANNNTDVSSVIASQSPRGDLLDVVDLFSGLIDATNMFESFHASVVRRIRCEGCGPSEVRSNGPRGLIPVMFPENNPGNADLVETLRALVQASATRDHYDCPNCGHSGTADYDPYSLSSATEMLTFEVRRLSGNISLPLLLNPVEIFPGNISTFPTYRLYAFAGDDQAATIRINNEWFISNNGTNLVPTAPVISESSIVSNSVGLVLYERV